MNSFVWFNHFYSFFYFVVNGLSDLCIITVFDLNIHRLLFIIVFFFKNKFNTKNKLPLTALVVKDKDATSEQPFVCRQFTGSLSHARSRKLALILITIILRI